MREKYHQTVGNMLINFEPMTWGNRYVYPCIYIGNTHFHQTPSYTINDKNMNSKIHLFN